MAEDVAGAGSPQGLSWSWELDFGALMDSLDGCAPRLGTAGRPGAASCGADRPGSASGGADRPGSASGGAASRAVPQTAAVSEDEDTAAGGDEAAAGGDEAAAGAGGLRDNEIARDDPDGLDRDDPEGAVPEGLDPEGLEEGGGGRLPAWVLAGRVAGKLAPGPDLAAWLAMAPAADLADWDLAAVAGAWRRLASWAQAGELAAVAQIAARSAARDEDIGTEPDGRPVRIPASAAAEVALELTMSRFGASWWADLAVQLGWRLAATGAALESGVIDLARARLIAEATGPLSDENARKVQDRVLPVAGDQTTGMLRAALRRAVIAVDPAGAEERRKEAERRSKVVLYPDQDSTATLAGQRLPAVHAAAAMARITAMARAMKASGAGGGMDLLRAQIYVGLLLGTLPLIPPAEGAPPDDPPPDDPPPDDPPRNDPGNDPDGDPGGPGPGDGPGGSHQNDAPAPASPPHDGPPDDGPPDDDDVPPLTDQDAPAEDDGPGPDDDNPDSGWARNGWAGSADDDDFSWRGPARDWPALPALIPPSPPGPGGGRPPGLLDVCLPWRTLAGISPAPGHLGRIGPITATQARQLAGCAARDPAAEWRVIVTSTAGQALAVTRIPRNRDGPPGPSARARPGDGTGLVARVTLTISEDVLTGPQPSRPGAGTGPDPPGGILARALRAAAAAAARARDAAAADAAAGGCAHTAASPGYRPPPRLREHITARDLTCRLPVCRQPAWRGDLDHTVPFDDGGITCACNLGGVCRADHQLKQHPGWSLTQTAPGIFLWTTPSGRTHGSAPDIYPT